ncbi:MAG: hypothetical protein HKN21_11925 [Candidatus Eisenbacteria bacterium]|uniref:SGNH/GDSL hydrolase family protein n=1 Tax=Eiseniibacteriota bacterium TaxID=2212470 RepID=A0A7Y2H353_UNCEI|nr:hypothetical protein [Candidatus Eisenbacteria bacterium]
MNDTADRWSLVRSQVGQVPGQTVVIGSSRIQFDFDLDTYAREMNTERPLQLAMPGTNPVGLLEHVADQEGFDGVLILGVAPGLWFVPQGPPVEWARRATGRYDNWSPSQKIGLRVASFLQSRLAFINPEDLTLEALLNHIDLPDRPGAVPNLPPVLPAYFAGMDEYRQARMWDRCDFGSERAKLIQQTWPPLFTPPPPPPHLSPEEFQGMLKANSEQYLKRIRVAVDKVRSRGAKVVFIRPPSTDTLRELETKFSPREQTWDLMLQVTGAPGIHFEDYPELAGFRCPEWSHLTAEDAVNYTTALMPLIRKALSEGNTPG